MKYKAQKSATSNYRPVYEFKSQADLLSLDSPAMSNDGREKESMERSFVSFVLENMVDKTAKEDMTDDIIDCFYDLYDKLIKADALKVSALNFGDFDVWKED